ncbi:uncharacterized protein [Miscanthus floridulus]|uniref:uncharacterized protein n=1 Tax=Miscanthus floridulus TaxID=154761 RepID=UPI0034580EC2
METNCQVQSLLLWCTFGTTLKDLLSDVTHRWSDISTTQWSRSAPPQLRCEVPGRFTDVRVEDVDGAAVGGGEEDADDVVAGEVPRRTPTTRLRVSPAKAAAPRRQGPMPAIAVDVPMTMTMTTGGRWTWGAINVERRRPAGRGGSVVGERLKGAGGRCDRLGLSASSRDLAGGWGRQRAATDRMRKGAGLLVAGLVSRRWEKGKASSSSLAPSCCEASWGSCGPPRWSAACRGPGCHGGEGSDAVEGSGATSRGAGVSCAPALSRRRPRQPRIV